MVSIIIPTFNSSQFIEETLESILNQEYTTWECILVDDGSTDNTIQLITAFLEKDSRFAFFKRPKELIKGANSCRNYGFFKSKGNFIQFFDSDDLMLPNHLNDKIKIINRDSNLEAIVNKISFYENGEITKETTIFSNNPLIDYCIDKIDYYTFGVLWSKNFLNKQKELFDVNISNLDDWDFIIRMLLAEPNIVLINTSTILYRQSANSLSKQIELCNPIEIESEIRARFKIFNIYKKKNIETEIIKEYLKFRLIQLYRLCLEKKQFNTALYCYNHLVELNLSSKEKLKLKLAYFTFRFFNKGYVLLK